MLNIVRVLTSLLLFFICQHSMAGTATRTLTVTANVGNVGGGGCVLAVTNMIFPSYNPLNFSADDTTSTITVTCSAGIPYDLGITAGMAPGATEDHRMLLEMAPNTTNILPYGLFKNTNHSDNWGDDIGEDTVHGVGNNQAQSLTVYGEIPAEQPTEPGIYMDRLLVIVTF